MRKKIALAFVLVTLSCVAVLGVAAYPHCQATLKERILSESTAAFATIELKLNQSIETAREDTLFLAGTPPPRGILHISGFRRIHPVMGTGNKSWPAHFQHNFSALLKNPHSDATEKFVREITPGLKPGDAQSWCA